MGSLHSTFEQDKMRCLLLLSVAVASVLSIPHNLPLPADQGLENDHINEILDVVESSLDNDPEGRALLFTVTKTKTNMVTETATVMFTVTEQPKCVALGTPAVDCASTTTTAAPTTEAASTSAASEATTEAATTTTAAATTAAATTTTTAAATTTETTTAAAGGRALSARHIDHDKEKRHNPFPGATVTRSDGKEASIFDILPTPVLEDAQGRIDMDSFDGVIMDEGNFQSGKLEWKEVAIQGFSTCGRSSGKRPRILTLSTVTVDVTTTIVPTTTVTAATVTHTVAGIGCTTAGFMFAVPAC